MNKLLKIGIPIVLFSAMLFLFTSCQLSEGSSGKQYLENKYDDSFEYLGRAPSGTYWYEVNGKPFMYVGVVRNNIGDKFDNYPMREAEYEFSQKIKSIIDRYSFGSFVSTCDNHITNGIGRDVDDVSAIYEESPGTAIQTNIFIEEKNADKHLLYQAAQEIKNTSGNLYGQFAIRIVQNGHMEDIEKIINAKSGCFLDGMDYEDISSVCVAESQEIPLPNHQSDSISIFPAETEFWQSENR